MLIGAIAASCAYFFAGLIQSHFEKSPQATTTSSISPDPPNLNTMEPFSA
jgi:hypothetical protein